MNDRERQHGLRDVARRAEVSLGTVANVYAGKATVSPETRAVVLAAAAELGYQPRPRALNSPPPVTNLAFIVRHRLVPLTNPFYSHVLYGAETACAVEGISLSYEVLPAPPDDALHLPRIVQRKQVQGVLVVGYVHPAVVAQLQRAGMPCVLVDYSTEPPTADSVRGDDERGGYLATRYLLDHGHNDPPPAIIVGSLDHPSIAERYAGYRRALTEGGFVPPDHFVRLGDLGLDSGYAQMSALLALPVPPTAVFCANDETAQGALSALHAHHIAVPEGCAVIGYDDVDQAAHAIPPLTTIRVDKDLLGAQAVRMLLERIASPHMTLRQMRLTVSLVERQSVGHRVARPDDRPSIARRDGKIPVTP